MLENRGRMAFVGQSLRPHRALVGIRRKQRARHGRTDHFRARRPDRGAAMSPREVENAPIALILHPHPKAGGTMQDPVTITLFEMFAAQGFSTMRFNFRGVGRSQGTFDAGVAELSDAAYVLDHLESLNEAPSQCWVAGSGFGAYICLQLLMRRPEIDGFVAVAPPANHYDLSFPRALPGLGHHHLGRQGHRRAASRHRPLADEGPRPEGRSDRTRHGRRRQPLLPGQTRRTGKDRLRLSQEAHESVRESAKKEPKEAAKACQAPTLASIQQMQLPLGRPCCFVRRRQRVQIARRRVGIIDPFAQYLARH